MKHVMKCFAALLLLHTLGTSAQQVSKSIPYGNKTQEQGWIIEKVENDFVIAFSVRCKIDEDVPSEFCCGMMRVNSQGELIWKNLMEFETTRYSRPSGKKCLLVKNDSIIASGFVYKGDTMYLRIFIAGTDGRLLDQKDYFIPYLYWNAGIMKNAKGYIVYNVLRDSTNNLNDYQILQMDYNFNIIKELKFGAAGRSGQYGTGCLLEDQSMIFTFQEWQSDNYNKNIRFAEVSPDLILLRQLELLKQELNVFGSVPKIEKAERDGYFISYARLIPNQVETSLFNPAMFKMDDSLNLIWERVFKGKYQAENLSFIIDEDKYLYVVGQTHPWGSDYYGWIYKMDQSGNLLWNRVIIDTSRKQINQVFFDIVELNQSGLALSGSIADTFFMNDPPGQNKNVWFLTLDENGCFNGNCKDTLLVPNEIMTGSKSNNTGLHELNRLFPNPASDYICLEFINSKKRDIKIYSQEGKLVRSSIINSPEHRLDVSEILNGNYFLTVSSPDNFDFKVPITIIK